MKKNLLVAILFSIIALQSSVMVSAPASTFDRVGKGITGIASACTAYVTAALAFNTVQNYRSSVAGKNFWDGFLSMGIGSGKRDPRYVSSIPTPAFPVAEVLYFALATGALSYVSYKCLHQALNPDVDNK